MSLNVLAKYLQMTLKPQEIIDFNDHVVLQESIDVMVEYTYTNYYERLFNYQ